MADYKRTFIALKTPPSPFFGKVITDFKKDIGETCVNWVKKEFLHLTFVYLGHTDTKQLKALDAALTNLCLQHCAFTIDVVGMGCFYTAKKPRVIWAGIKENETLNNMYAYIKNETDNFFKIENKPFKPHITLGRIKHNCQSTFDVKMLEKYNNLPLDSISIKSIYLYESILMHDGAEYRPLKFFNLADK